MYTKQIIVVREDLNMSRGKIGSQCAHAAMKVVLDAMERIEIKTFEENGDNRVTDNLILNIDDPELSAWILGQFTKIVCVVKNEEKLMALYNKVQEAGLRASLIIDNGTTEFGGVKTATCIAIGPHTAERLDPFTKRLQLLK